MIKRRRAICLQGKRDIRCACDIIAVWRLRYVANSVNLQRGYRRAIRESPLQPAVSSSREHTWCLCRSFAEYALSCHSRAKRRILKGHTSLKDDGKGGVASYATEGSRRADDIRPYEMCVITRRGGVAPPANHGRETTGGETPPLRLS